MDTARLVINSQLNRFEPVPVYRATEILEILNELTKRAWVSGAIDHLLQNPRNSLSSQLRPLDRPLWLYESRDLRLFYVPQVP